MPCTCTRQILARMADIWREGLEGTKKFADHGLSGVYRVRDLCRVSIWTFAVCLPGPAAVSIPCAFCLFCHGMYSSVCPRGSVHGGGYLCRVLSLLDTRPELLSTVAFVYSVVNINWR
jgi:hypothetical protein